MDLTFSVLVHLPDCLQKRELSAVVAELALYSCGPAIGLERATYCLATVLKSYPALRLTPQLVVQLLQPFEAVRYGTEVFFYNMVGSRPHWLDQDVRRLRLHFLPDRTFGKVEMFNRVPFDSISLRDCTAKGKDLLSCGKLPPVL